MKIYDTTKCVSLSLGKSFLHPSDYWNILFVYFAFMLSYRRDLFQSYWLRSVLCRVIYHQQLPFMFVLLFIISFWFHCYRLLSPHLTLALTRSKFTYWYLVNLWPQTNVYDFQKKIIKKAFRNNSYSSRQILTVSDR